MSFVLVTAFYVAFIIFEVAICQSTQTPQPRITNQFVKEVSYKVGEQAVLTCEAEGRPPPRFEWRKNEEPLFVDNGHIKWKISPSDSGSIVINEPASSDEGIYQCIARNIWGAVVSSKTLFKKAVLEPFPSVKQPKIHRPDVGMPFVLTCNPPTSYPPGLVYWGENKPGSRLKPIENTARISSDYSGNLYFSNIQPEDNLHGFSYVCIVQNMALRSLVQGDDQAIHTVNVTDKPRYKPPQLMWSSTGNVVAIRGEITRMKCIFSGYPTPQVSWERMDSAMSPSADFRSFGQEVVIKNVQYDDEGNYRCSASNGESAAVHKHFELKVESTPYWRQEQAPEDVTVVVDDPAQVRCLADGKPRPTVSWFINGQPIAEVPVDHRRTVSGNTLSYTEVTKADAQVVQCNASNVHGYILANAFINVVAEPPSFISTPKSFVKVVEGKDVTLTCRVSGAPKPRVLWRHSKSDEVPRDLNAANRKLQQQSTGDLLIKDLVKNDSGQYICVAQNKFGTESVSGQLVVLERTVITEGPKDLTVTASSLVVLPCNAETDPSETSHLVIEWHRNGERIDFRLSPHLEQNMQNNSLIVRGAKASDTANYTCHANSGTDQAVATAQLIVQDRPAPPSKVWIVNKCVGYKAEVKWIPGTDNNDPIKEYIVYGNTSHDPPDRFNAMSHVPGVPLKPSLVSLKPWTTYSFHVTARNALGESKRSHFTSEETNCTTPSAAPFRHPNKVCTESRKENELVITWEPMEQTEHNGENFHYIVGYKLRGDADVMTQQVSDWRMNEAVIPDQAVFAAYEIFVKSVNNIGEGPRLDLKTKLGYSGQGIPLNKPENFTVLSFNSSSATFTWQAVKENPDLIKGFFLGYRIKFWKTGDSENPRLEDVILRSFDPCPELSRERKRRKSGKNGVETLVSGHTNKLWAFSDVTAVVMVLNGALHAGPVSNSIQFQTPEGVPEAVTNFEVTEKGSSHFVVSWNPPDQPNGILTGYVIEFEEAPSGIIQNKIYVDPSTHRKKIYGLKNNTNYVVHIRATTSVGSGPEILLQEKTNQSSVPSKPGISELNVGDDFVAVSWQTSVDGENSGFKNPGSVYGVEYRPEGSKEWLRTNNITDDSHINITGLEKGITYEVRVVAFNDHELHSTSDIAVATTGPKTETARSIVTSFVLTLILIGVVLFLLLFIVCIICYVSYYREGGVYSVNEREKKHGCAAGKDDEPSFGEYVRPPEPYKGKSSSSLNSLAAKKPVENLDSDNDSLGEYADPDPSKFAEDGSFIGQYGNKKTANIKDHPLAPFSTYI